MSPAVTLAMTLAAEAGEAAVEESFLGLGPEAWVGLSLLVLVLLFAKLGVFRMIGQALDSRADRIRAEIEEARNLKQEAQTELAKLQRSQREAAEDAREIVARAEEDARILLAEASEEIERVSERRRAAAEERIARAEQDALAAIRAEAATLAIAAARQILAGKLAGEEGDRLIEDSIGQIDDRLH